jgi:outer membrane cobalamin receptor
VAYSHRFSFGLIAAADLQMMGSRQADLKGDVLLDSFILATLSAEYPILPRLRVRGWIGNLFGAVHEWWLGYTGLPRNGGLALSYSW